jgi:CBS domain-containing protein
VADVMERDVVSIGPDTAVHQAAWILAEHGLSGLPVVDMSERLLGVVSEQDLVVRLASRPRRPWWHLVVDADALAREYRRGAGTTVGQVMTHPAITVSPSLPVQSAARLFDGPGVSLVPVVAAGRVVGTLSRRDLVRMLIAARPAPVRRSDTELKAEMQAQMRDEAWLLTPRPVVHVDDGAVALWGLVDSEEQKAALETMARAIPGCRMVESHLVAKETIRCPYGI